MFRFLPSRKYAAMILALSLIVGGSVYFGMYHYAEIPSDVLAHFRNAARIEFCTIKPDQDVNTIPDDFGYGDIEGYSIVDRVYLKNQGSVISAVSWSDRLNNQYTAKCFRPRHAIRDSEDRENYLLICFECMQLRYNYEGKTGTVSISQSKLPFFESLADLHSMTRASDLRTD